MGTAANLCVNNRYVSTTEMILDNSIDDPAVSEDYKRKTKTDEVLKMLIFDKFKNSHSPKTYTKGKVKVSVF